MTEESLRSTLDPIVSEVPGGVLYEYIEQHNTWPALQIRDVKRSRSGDIMCELTAFCEKPGSMTPCTGIKFNLSSLSARKQTATGLKESYLDSSATWIDWTQILNDVCLRTIKLYHNGHDVEDVWPIGEIPKPSYLIEPILPLHQPTIIFGEGGAGKGHFTMTLAIIAQLPFIDNNLGVKPLTTPSNCLYLDYESDYSAFQRTLSGLCMGLETAVGLKRMQMSAPIPDCIEQISNKVFNEKIEFIIVDSLGPAAGGNINDAEPAIKLYSCLRQLKDVTTLIIAHNSKDPLSRTKSVYGSVFFTNLARSVWELKKSQIEDSSEMIVALKHIKYNARKQSPMGFCFTFDNDTGGINVKRQDLTTTELEVEMKLEDRIKNLLLRDGLQTQVQITEKLGVNKETIKTYLWRGVKKQYLVKVGDGYGIPSNY